MNIIEAYAKVKRLPERNILTSCLDLGDRWAFFFLSKALASDDVVLGGVYDAVNKVTGELSCIPSNPDNWGTLDKGKRVDIEQFIDV